MRRLNSSVLNGRLVRYIAAGGVAFIVDYTTLLVLTEWAHLHYLWSATVGFVLGSVVCYVLSVRWVFDQRRFERRWVEFAWFVAIGVFGLGLNDLLLWGLVSGFGIPYPISKVLVSCVVLFFNYSVRLVLVFSARFGEEAERDTC